MGQNGVWFDLRAELYKSDRLMASRLIRCITGITRNPNNAIEVTVPFDSFTPATFDGSTDLLRLRLLTRIGTNTDDTKCATGHGSAVGLRLYFDGINQGVPVRSHDPVAPVGAAHEIVGRAGFQRRPPEFSPRAGARHPGGCLLL